MTSITPLHQPKSRERGDFKEDEREKEPISTKVIEPRKGRGLSVCEHAVRGGGSRPLHLRPVDTICFKLNKIGLQNDGDRQHSSIAYNERSEVKSNLCQGINIYRAINAYKPNSTMIKFNSALSQRGQARPKL